MVHSIGLPGAALSLLLMMSREESDASAPKPLLEREERDLIGAIDACYRRKAMQAIEAIVKADNRDSAPALARACEHGLRRHLELKGEARQLERRIDALERKFFTPWVGG